MLPRYMKTLQYLPTAKHQGVIVVVVVFSRKVVHSFVKL